MKNFNPNGLVAHNAARRQWADNAAKEALRAAGENGLTVTELAHASKCSRATARNRLLALYGNK
ncbi:hypothetical protein [Ralstonia solanacearum]|uniref:hypothetical protein n=1 Tax=Ralstonia solanacearum TaxID=305 RepID=UPI0011C47E6B|nr:hypothetical protein [Ralstonia solanacearum]